LYSTVNLIYYSFRLSQLVTMVMVIAGNLCQSGGKRQ